MPLEAGRTKFSSAEYHEIAGIAASGKTGPAMQTDGRTREGRYVALFLQRRPAAAALHRLSDCHRRLRRQAQLETNESTDEE